MREPLTTMYGEVVFFMSSPLVAFPPFLFKSCDVTREKLVLDAAGCEPDDEYGVDEEADEFDDAEWPDGCVVDDDAGHDECPDKNSPCEYVVFAVCHSASFLVREYVFVIKNSTSE